MAFRRVLSNNNVTPVHEATGRFSIYYRGALRRTDAGHGRRVHALAVSSATYVLGVGTESVQKNNVHLRRGRSYMFFLYTKSSKYPIVNKLLLSFLFLKILQRVYYNIPSRVEIVLGSCMKIKPTHFIIHIVQYYKDVLKLNVTYEVSTFIEHNILLNYITYNNIYTSMSVYEENLFQKYIINLNIFTRHIYTKLSCAIRSILLRAVDDIQFYIKRP